MKHNRVHIQEDTELKEAFPSVEKIPSLVHKHQRTSGAIRSRLQNLDLLMIVNLFPEVRGLNGISRYLALLLPENTILFMLFKIAKTKHI